MTAIRIEKSALLRSSWIGLLAVAVGLVLFVGAAPGAPDHIYTVNTTSDAVNGGCDTTCTLPDAITGANGDTDASQIRFAIPGSGPKTIQLTQALPAITAPVTIDGTTQGDVVAIDGGAVTDEVHNQITSGVQGLVLAAGSGGSTIRALAFGNFEISQQADAALEIDSNGNEIVGDSFGVEADGTTAAPNEAGILVTGNSNIIGGSSVADRNVVVNSYANVGGLDADGILIQGNGDNVTPNANAILGNYIGLLGDGSTLASNEDVGIHVLDATNTQIGGPTAADGNVLATDQIDDILLGSDDPSGSGSTGGNSTVENNALQMSADKQTDISASSPNAIQVSDTGSNTIAGNTIGSTYQGIDVCNSPNNAITGNVIGSNTANPGGPDFGVIDQGISVESIAASGCAGQATASTGNMIGGSSGAGNTIVGSQLNDLALDADQNTASYNTFRGTKGGAVVDISGIGNQLSSNTITGGRTSNQNPSFPIPGNGVEVDSGTGNAISKNSIHGNAGLGIALQSGDFPTPLPNDTGDGDGGPNDQQNYPVLDQSKTTFNPGGTLTVTGSLNSTANAHFTIELFQSSNANPSGNGEGAHYLGSVGVATDGSGNAQFSPTFSSVSSGKVISATATASNGDTSEFSQDVTASGTPQTFVVNDTSNGDGSCTDDACSLTDAINAANQAGGGTIDFDIPGSGVQTITPHATLPTITAPVTIDGTSQPGYSGTPLIYVTGDQCQECGGFGGLEVDSGSGSVIKGLAVGGFDEDPGIELQSGSSDTTISDSYVGVAPDGTQDGNAGGGILIANSNGNTIGGTGHGNLISGNVGDGVFATGVTNTQVVGNRIGVNAGGTSALANGQFGIELDNANTTTVQGNVLSGNHESGMQVEGNTTGTTFLGNRIGTTADGNGVIGNTVAGIYLGGVDDTTIGGPNPGDGNVISGNDVGINVGPGAQGTKISGNNIGTNAGGTAALVGSEWGILDGGNGTVIGGPTAGDRNLISGNPDDGIGVNDSGGATIEGNWIGLDSTGNDALGNTGAGIRVDSGTAAIRDNVISGNQQGGIVLETAGNTIFGNRIGTTADGTGQVGNSGDGVNVASDDNVIGGPGPDANVISGNTGAGVNVKNATGTQIADNLIGTDAAGSNALGNTSVGVNLDGTQTTTVQDNVISANASGGMVLSGNATGTTIVGNLVGTDATGNNALGNGSNGVDLAGAPGTIIGGTGPGSTNVISANEDAGIEIDGVGGVGAIVQGNFVGTDAAGTSALGNGDDGIYISVSGSTIGGDSAGVGNVISGNTGTGVHLEGGGADGNTVSGNLIGTDATGTQPLGNKDDGILINAGAANNTIGGTDAAAANVISDNGSAPSLGGGGGVDLRFTPGSGNVVEGNLIGTDLSGGSNLGNAHFGVTIDGSAQTIGGTVAGAGNTIAFNNGPGIVDPNSSGADDENVFRQNLIHDNTGLGIELDGGANDGIAAPTIAAVAGNQASGTLTGFAANDTVTIEFFGNASCDNVNGAGRDFLGSTQVQPQGGTTNWSATLSGLGSDTGVTATATDKTPETSEFSNCATVGPPVFTVNTTADSNDGSCTPTLCSLRDAVIAANADPGSTIDFAIPAQSVITLQTPLPSITEPVTIDGTTAPGTPLNSPGVTIVPTGNVQNTSLLDLAPGSHGSIVHGLAFGGNSIGSGTTAISAESDQDTITGNWIGVAADSTPLTLGAYGIAVTGGNETIGGGSAATANVITGSVQDAISINSPDGGETQPIDETIQGNLIGLFPSGLPANAQGNGISITDSIGTVIGSDVTPDNLAGVNPALGNVISGMGDAIDILGNSRQTVAAGNFIGVDRTGKPTSPNINGIVVAGSSGNQIGPGDNIVHATHDAVEVAGSGANSNRIVANSIFASGNLGIDLQSGGNDGLAAPTITSASSVTGVVSGTWSGSNPAFIEVFTNPSCNAPYASGAGQTYIEFVNATPGQIWTATIGGLTNGTGVTATATDSTNVDTSEFSNCVTASVAQQLSNLNVNVSGSPAGAGIDQVPISAIPNAWLSFYAGTTNSSPVGSTPVGSTPVGSTPVGSTPVGSTPVGSTPVGSTPVGSTPVGSTPVGSTGLLALPVGSTPVGSTALGSLLLSQIPLCGDTPLPGTNQATCISDGATWAKVLAGTSFANLPLNSVTLANLVTSADPTAKNRLAALPLRDVSFATSLFQSVHWASLLLGPTPLESLPPPTGFNSWCGGSDPAIPADGGSCANVNSSTSVLQMDVGGHLGSAPVGSTPVGSTPVGSTPVGSTPVGSTKISESRLATIPLTDIATYDGDLSMVVDCTNPKISCSPSTTNTLGDAATASAIKPGATFSSIQGAMNHDGITYDDVLISILGAAGLPWEQLSLQGLQPYSQTQSTVHYTITTNVDCSAVSQFTLTARLPDGFFPVNNSARAAVGNNAPASAGAPTVDQKSNGYQWTLNCPAGDTSVETATLTFDSWVGLNLGTFSTAVIAAAGSFSISQSGAPVTVHQNSEAQDPSTATSINPDTLVAGHIAFGGEQSFYKLNLTGLPSGTKISAFLNVPSDADLDLTMSAPAAPSLDASPVGSTPVGSTPIADTGTGFTGNGQALSPDTLQDVPVGSTPVGSTPVGSTPVGSTSDSRGAGVNESGAIITNGQTGVATIGISGYNGASSDQPFVLRVQETPPPTLPACPARTFANGSPSNFAAGTLPATLPAATKTVFIVDKQRLTAMYGATAVTTLLNGLNTLAARSEVSGTVLSVDGNAAVRSAYSAWDATPCNTSARNNVVKAINDVVAGYRANNALPNLHYIVLVGSDEATPMADTPDPVLLSPEEDEASGLAFTTNGGTQGNALYASAAQNQILSDGAYGAFTNIQWLGQALLLPQLSVSRLVESPTDILGQINRYLKANGYTGTPQSGVGTLNPTSATVTGYDFLADGSQSVANNLAHQFGGLSAPANFANGDPSIFNPPTTWKALTAYKTGDVVQAATSTSSFFFQAQNAGTSSMAEPIWPTVLGGTVTVGGITWKAIRSWSATDVISSVLASANPASIDAISGHYNQYELEAADGTLASTAQATSANLAARILFTMGCHGGLNVADTLPGGNPSSPSGQYLDWPELYGKDQAAVYIGNTGFGYGDTASVALSERLMALYARNLHSNTDSVGEQWAETLGQYFATAGAYDVYDEKVMEETTFYGLPFWHFGTAPVTPLAGSLSSVNAAKPLTTASGANPAVASASSVPTSVDPITGTQSATVNFPATGDTTQSQFGLYRPVLPITSQEVTSSTGPATGLWINSLSTSDTQNVTPKIGYPTIDLSAHEPIPAVQPIFFPASPFTLEHSYVFGNERDYLNVSDQFRPDSPADGKGTQRHVVSGQFEVFYGNPSDQISPLISDVDVMYSAGTANLAVRATDPSNPVDEVAVLVNDGMWHYVRLTQSSDPTLWTGSISNLAENPEVFAEATDGTNVSYSANKGSNFTSVPADEQSPSVITLASPFGTYNQGATVSATFSCSAPAVQCTATLDGNPIQSGAPINTSTLGQHTFVVTAADADGNVLSSLQRVYSVKAKPTISWSPPSSILFGTALGPAQLNATANVPGTFAYTPAAGTLLQPGSQTLSVTFTPTDTTDYGIVTATRTIKIGFSQACQTGGLSSSLTIKSGTSYCIQGGKVSGSITVQSGASLYVSGGSISGSLTSTGAAAITFCGSNISGPISVSSSTGLVEVGASSGNGCAGNKISGNVTINGNSGGVTFANNTVSGNVTIANNTGGFKFSGNTISGSTTLSNNS